jgi:phage baseplate assembly protein W/LysM repeat protein
MTPESQKTSPIGFYLEGGGPAPVSFTMYIRPEDISRPEPSRITPVQTLGGAWVDAWGRGLSTITLAGHQGWRGNALQSGQSLFAQLRSTVFTDWHSRRAANVALGLDPNTVSLYYVDILNNITAKVVPMSFTLRRNKTSPLLMRYQIQLLVLDDQNVPQTAIDAVTNSLTDPSRWIAALASIGINVQGLQGFLTTAIKAFNTIAAPIKAFIATATEVFNTVSAIAQYAQGVFDATVGTVLQGALGLAIAGRNAFYALASTATGITEEVRGTISGIASAFSDIYCSMVNGFNLGAIFTSFDPFLGASNCSSTAGGDPPSYFTVNGSNPFEAYYTSATPAISISAAAQLTINDLALDPLTISGQTAAIGAQLATISAGVTSAVPAAIAAALAGAQASASVSVLASGITAGAVNNQPSFTKTLKGYRKVETQRGDTLQKIAARELSDASQWPNLATLNNLVPPYITDDPTQAGVGVVVSGTPLIVPAPAPAPSAVSDPNTIFGTDALLSGSGSGAAWNGLLVATEDGDIETVAGVPNLAQALQNVLITEPGELLFHLLYGCKIYQLLGAGNGPIAGQLGAGFVAQALKSDTRISDVENATATITLDQLSVSAAAITTAGKYLPVGIAQLPG